MQSNENKNYNMWNTETSNRWQRWIERKKRRRKKKQKQSLPFHICAKNSRKTTYINIHWHKFQQSLFDWPATHSSQSHLYVFVISLEWSPVRLVWRQQRRWRRPLGDQFASNLISIGSVLCCMTTWGRQRIDWMRFLALLAYRNAVRSRSFVRRLARRREIWRDRGERERDRKKNKMFSGESTTNTQ